MIKDSVFECISDWLNARRGQNPSFNLFLGDRSYTIDQVLEHIEKDTDVGRELRKNIITTATDLFLNYKPKVKIIETEYRVIN